MFPVDLSSNYIVPFLCDVHFLILLVPFPQVFLEGAYHLHITYCTRLRGHSSVLASGCSAFVGELIRVCIKKP